MIPFYISLSVDDDFGFEDTLFTKSSKKKVRGIIDFSNNESIVDPKIFENKNYFKPVEYFLKNNISILDLLEIRFIEIMKEFGKFELKSNGYLKFEDDNNFDLESAFIDKSSKLSRISLNFRNCPVNSFYLIDNGQSLKIIVSPFTKNYYTITEVEWYTFIEYIEEGVSEMREAKLNEILSDKVSYINLMRQLKFIVKNKRSNSFLNSVYSYYEKNGYITEKQAKFIMEQIWNK